MKSIRIAAALALLSPLVCHATLGAAPSADARTPQSMLRAAASGATSSPSYTVHESQTSDGVTVREYASAANVVFAVTWQGPIRPDMRALLGSYFLNFVNAGQSHARGTGPLIGREGANVTITRDGAVLASTEGPYDGPCVLQALAPEARFSAADGQQRFPVLGLWMIDQECGGMGIRESVTPITDNLSSFVPHSFRQTAVSSTLESDRRARIPTSINHKKSS